MEQGESITTESVEMSQRISYPYLGASHDAYYHDCH